MLGQDDSSSNKGDKMIEQLEFNREQAFRELRKELREFIPDGLIKLEADLTNGKVRRGSWAGCVLSYRRGGARSVMRDSRGRARNSFTVLWDNSSISNDEVREVVRAELVRRRSAPAGVGGSRLSMALF